MRGILSPTVGSLVRVSALLNAGAPEREAIPGLLWPGEQCGRGDTGLRGAGGCGCILRRPGPRAAAPLRWKRVH